MAKAEAERVRIDGLAKAEAEKAKGETEAEVIRLKGLAEAEAKEKIASAFEQYGRNCNFRYDCQNASGIRETGISTAFKY